MLQGGNNNNSNFSHTGLHTSQNQIIPYCQPLQDTSQNITGTSQLDQQQAMLQAQMLYLYQKQQESQQQYNQLGQNLQSLFQSNFNSFGNKFFDHQSSVLQNQQQQYILLQQEQLKQQMQGYTQQQQQIQHQLLQQYDSHGTRLLENQSQQNQQLAQNIQQQNSLFQTQQAQYTQHVNAQYQESLQSFKTYLENLLQSNTDSIYNRFQQYYQQTSASLEQYLENISRDIALSNDSDNENITTLKSQQSSLQAHINNLKNISSYIQKDLSLLCKAQNELYTTSIEGNNFSNQQQCDILNFCFKQIISKIDTMHTQKVDHILSDSNKLSQYIQNLKFGMKDIQRSVSASIDSIVLQRFERFESHFNKKVEDISSLLTVNDQKITPSQLQQAIPKRPSTQSIIKQDSSNSSNFINQGQQQQPQSFTYMPQCLPYQSPQYQVAQNFVGQGLQPQYNSSISMQQPLTNQNMSLHSSPKLQMSLPQINSMQSQHYQPQSLSQVMQPPPTIQPPLSQVPMPPPSLPYMGQQPSFQQRTQSQPIHQNSVSLCTDPQCQDPSCTTLTRKHEHIPMYNGSTPLYYWLRRLDREIQSCGYTDHQAFLLAQSKMYGDAQFWLDQTESKFLIFQHPINSSMNKYSYQLLKPLLAKKFTKSFEQFFEDLDKIKQQPKQSYKRFMRRLQVESQHGSVSMRYLKQVFVRNILNRNVAIHLSHHINDENLDLQQLAYKAISIERELSRSRSRSLFRSQRPFRFRSNSSKGSRFSNRSRSSSHPSYRSNSSSSYYIPSRSASPISHRSQSPTSSSSSKFNPRFKRYKSPSDRPRFKDKPPSPRDRKTQHVSLSSATSIVKPKLSRITPLQQSSSILPIDNDQQPPHHHQQQTSGMVSNTKQQNTSNKDVSNFSIRETLNNLKVQLDLPMLLRNSKVHLQSFYDFVSDLEQPLQSTQTVSHVAQGLKTRITASRVDTMKYLNVFINNMPIQAILDGGSQPSLINISLCKQLGYTTFKSCNTAYSMVDTSTFTPLGLLSIPVSLSDTLEVLLELVVVQDCGFQLLLGLDFITCTQMVQYPKKVQVKNPTTKRYLDLPLLERSFDSPQRSQLVTTPKLRKRRQQPIKQVRIPKRNRKQQNISHILYPNFPTQKYNLILCDPPWHYKQVNSLTPQYRTLSFTQLKTLPINQIAANDSVFLYWTTGPMLRRSQALVKEYNFKHLTVFHVWRKLRSNRSNYSSRTNIANLTQPNCEFLIIAYRGNYKHLLNNSIPHVTQDIASHVLPHSQKPKYVYQTISKIFNVSSFPCIELFATITTHPYLDLYGDQVPNYFQPSQKVISSKTHFSSTRGCILSIAKQPFVIPQNLKPHLLKFKSSMHSQLCTLLKDTPFVHEQIFQCITLLSKFLHIFAWSSHAVGRMTNVKHSIQLLPNAQPKAFVPYRLSQEDRLFVEQEIKALLKLGYIERCASPWAAPVIVVPKEGGKRMVIDFRYLNSQTIKEHWPLPNFQDFLSYLPNARFISKIDLKSGFFNQLYASIQDENLTSFVCHLGQFRTTRLWFGLCNAPSSFQRAIMDALGDLVFQCVLVYIDDILIYSQTFDQHLHDMKRVFQALEKANVKLHPTKCSLFTTSCDFLGHTISNGTITPKLKRFSLLQNMSYPKTKTQIKCFLGLISYYRRFINQFSSIAKPLTDLLQKDVAFVWTDQHSQSFATLRDLLLQLPTLHLPVSNRIFVLNTDFSSKGLGAVLQQKDNDGTLYPIEFISRTLNKHEQRYGSYEGETLAVIFALSRFRHFLMGQQFILQTDNHALQQVLKNKSNSPKLHRWLLQLSEFNFTVVHKKGSENSHADALSRLAPLTTTQQSCNVFYHRTPRRVHFLFKPIVRFYKPYTFPNLHKRYVRQSRQQFINPQKIKSILHTTSHVFSITPQESNIDNVLPYQPYDLPDIRCEGCDSTDNASDMYICEYCGKGFHSFCFPPCPIVVPKQFYYCNSCISKIQRLSKKDPILDFQLLHYLMSKKFPNTMSSHQRERILHRCKRYSFKNNTFFIFVKGNFRILPTILGRQQLLFEFHDNTSHPGVHKTISLVMQKYFWPSMRHDVRQHIKACTLCACKKAEYRDSSSLQPLPKGVRPFQYWHVDLLTDLPPSREDFKHILICICSFSKWCECLPLKNRSALEIAHAFYRDIICRYGPPFTVVCDNGGEFQAEFTTLLQYINCHQKYINPNRPRANGQAERFVQTTTRLLRSTIHSNNIALNDWPTCLPTVLYTLRLSNSIHPISPFQIIYGFVPNVISPLDQCQDINQPNPSNYDVQLYVDTLAKFQQDAFSKTAKRLQQQFDKGNYYYQKKSSRFPYTFKVNDLVFKSAGRTSKLQLSSEGPFVITSFKNPTTAILLDPSNKTSLQSSIYNLVPMSIHKNNTLDNTAYEQQQLQLHKRTTRKNTKIKRKSN